MDTRFWGPSGWQLLHLIAADPAIHDKKATAEFFELLEFVLPCKYCRASFHDYMEEQPLTAAIVGEPEAFGHWVYDIHNRVNDKLRSQGLLKTANPSWCSVRDRYARLQAGLCTPDKGREPIGWNFMTSVAFATPGVRSVSTPMPDTPQRAPADLKKRNRYNLLTKAERAQKLAAWWKLIPAILPCEEWRAAWSAGMASVGEPPVCDGRNAMMRWMWRVEEAVCAGLRCPKPHPSRKALILSVRRYESGCSAAKRGKTCRALPQGRGSKKRATKRLRKRREVG
jgi:hypothetical protein